MWNCYMSHCMCILPVGIASNQPSRYSISQLSKCIVLSWNLWFVSSQSLLFVCVCVQDKDVTTHTKHFFSYYDLTFAKVPHAEIPFQYLFFFQSEARRVPRHKSLCVQQAVLNIVTPRCAVLSLLEPRISAQCLWITKLLLYCTSCQLFLFI